MVRGNVEQTMPIETESRQELPPIHVPDSVSVALLRSLIRDEGEYFELEYHCFAGSGYDPEDLLEEAVSHFEWLGVAVVD